MEKLLSVKDIQIRYQCSPNTARNYIRQMVHMEKPLMVKEREVERWELSRTLPPAKDIRRAIR